MVWAEHEARVYAQPPFGGAATVLVAAEAGGAEVGGGRFVRAAAPRHDDLASSVTIAASQAGLAVRISITIPLGNRITM